MKIGEALGGFKLNPPNSKGVGIGRERGHGAGWSPGGIPPSLVLLSLQCPSLHIGLVNEALCLIDSISELSVLVSDHLL